MPRHITQIAFSQTVDDTTLYQSVLALCADNSIWQTGWDGTRAKWSPWKRLPDIPSEREITPK